MRISVVQWSRNPMLNVVAKLQQRCGNVLIMSETNVGLTLIFDCAQRCDNVKNDVVTTLSQRRCTSWVLGWTSKILPRTKYFLVICSRGTLSLPPENNRKLDGLDVFREYRKGTVGTNGLKFFSRNREISYFKHFTHNYVSN